MSVVRPRFVFYLLGICLIAFTATGCAVGYGFGAASADYGANDTDSTLRSEQEVSAATTYHEFRAIDSSGFLLAALVNTGRQYTARQEAIQSGVDSDGDGKIEYSYKPMAIMPGVITDLRVRLAAGDPRFEFDGQSVDFGEKPRYFALDIKSEFFTWAQEDLPVVGSMFFGMLYENYAFDATVESFNQGALDVTYGLGAGWAPHPNVMISGRAQLGLVTWVVSLLAGYNKTWLHGTADLEIGWRPIEYVTISTTGSFGRMSTGSRPVRLVRFGANVMATF